jgi:hypothetical protein
MMSSQEPKCKLAIIDHILPFTPAKKKVSMLTNSLIPRQARSKKNLIFYSAFGPLKGRLSGNSSLPDSRVCFLTWFVPTLEAFGGVVCI